jgi:hypothetical protein
MDAPKPSSVRLTTALTLAFILALTAVLIGLATALSLTLVLSLATVVFATGGDRGFRSGFWIGRSGRAARTACTDEHSADRSRKQRRMDVHDSNLL